MLVTSRRFALYEDLVNKRPYQPGNEPPRLNGQKNACILLVVLLDSRRSKLASNCFVQARMSGGLVLYLIMPQRWLQAGEKIFPRSKYIALLAILENCIENAKEVTLCLRPDTLSPGWGFLAELL